LRKNWWIGVAIALLSLCLTLTIGGSLSQQWLPAHCDADPAFVLIPAGKFILGSDRTERDYAYRISAKAIVTNVAELPQAEQGLRQRRWFDRESEPQQRSLPAFCISRNLVTNAEYQTFVAATGHPPPSITAAEYQQQGFLVHPYETVQPYLWQGTAYPLGEAQHPVVLVSYADAIAYSQWKSQQDRVTYRLPTAEEWEKAARSEDGRYFPWGNQWQAHATNWAGSGLHHTSAIATYPLSRSPYGVEDMSGNVFEFTSSLQNNPTASEPSVLLKGCSWDDLPGFCRAAYQHTRPAASRHILFGFRLVRSPSYSYSSKDEG
jgi:toxoflavin biosynthesis protein ToxD